ncbi:hypothetical protein IB274_13850 [Pseudomonas sp. PDM18]|uniref:hypothetical protein n=1 Tax=Pseudomonas sp. PDM18 TaxID=2769253 RepID=UPI001781C099|nr:hypothetical protein [Pseudomonas sp. PDM18]MBD9677791.1 hypothetical protein [Pseudomonas sp. PDM18]
MSQNEPRTGSQSGRQNIPGELHPEWSRRGDNREDQLSTPKTHMDEPEVLPSDPDIAGLGDEGRPC